MSRLLLKLAAIIGMGYLAHLFHRPLQPLSEGARTLAKGAVGILTGLPAVWLMADEVKAESAPARATLTALAGYSVFGVGVAIGWVVDANRERAN